MPECLRYQRILCENLRDCLENDTVRFAVVRGRKNIGKTFSVYSLREFYEVADAVKNPETAQQFLVQLQACLNPYKKGRFSAAVRTSVAKALQIQIPFYENLNAVINLFRANTKQTEEIIIALLRQICSGCRLVVPICYDGVPSTEMQQLYRRLLETDFHGKLKLVFISSGMRYDFFFAMLCKEYGWQPFDLELADEDLKIRYADEISGEIIEQVLALTDRNVGQAVIFIEYLLDCKEGETAKAVEDIAAERLHTLMEDERLAPLLQYSAYFEKYFSLDELRYIFKELDENLGVYNDLQHYLGRLVRENVYGKKEEAYYIVLEVFKTVLKQHGSDDRRLIKNIEKCIRRFNPTDYKTRYTLIKNIDKKYASALLGIWHMHNLRFNLTDEIYLQEALNAEDDFFKNYIRDMDTAYDRYRNYDFAGALTAADRYAGHTINAWKEEADYISALCVWQLERGADTDSYHMLKDLFENAGEEEIKIFSGLTLLSILTNNAQYIDGALRKAGRLFAGLEGMLPDTDTIYNTLRYILYRKAPSVFDSRACLHYTQESLTYFREHSFVFHTEYLMSLNNHAAALLHAGDPEQARQILQEVITDGQAIRSVYSAYIYHNYIVSKILSEIPVTEEEICNYLSFSRQATADNQIMADILAGTYYAQTGAFDHAKTLYNRAQRTNAESGGDDFYDYYIYTNLCAVACITGEMEQALAAFSRCDYAPALAKPLERQYYKKRNECLRHYLYHDRAGDLEALLKESFTIFKTNEYSLFSRVFLFTDTQFWTEN